jgi:hypothetical protein
MKIKYYLGSRRKKYPTYNKRKENQIDWLHLEQELLFKTHFWRNNKTDEKARKKKLPDDVKEIKHTVNWNRKHWIVLCGGLFSEESMDMSQDFLSNELLL